jgi:chromosome segregation ATPase
MSDGNAGVARARETLLEGDRRSFDAEFRERLIRVETQMTATAQEVVKLRDRAHDAATTLASIAIQQEEAQERRSEMSQKIDTLTSKIDPVLITTSQLATTVATHIAQCHEDKREINEKLNSGDEKQNTRHIENIARFGKLEARLAMYIGIATGAWLLISLIINKGAVVAQLLR